MYVVKYLITSNIHQVRGDKCFVNLVCLLISYLRVENQYCKYLILKIFNEYTIIFMLLFIYLFVFITQNNFFQTYVASVIVIFIIIVRTYLI